MADKVRDKNKLKNAIVTTRSERDKLLRVVFVVLITIAAAAFLIFSLYWLKQVLFTQNPRLTLREVTVNTVGFWENREELLARRLNLKPGVNLFAVDVRKTRQELLKIPSVERGEVIRVLPDQIQLKIVERVPRAILMNPRSPWVVDENGFVVPRYEINPRQLLSLPVLLGVPKDKIVPGRKIDELKPALELIMHTVRSFPDIGVIGIDDADNPEKLKFHMRFRQSKICTVTMPVRSNMEQMLNILQSAILQSEASAGEPGRYFDLSFDGSVVIK
jgi:cell division septal protein FtsQ